MSYAWHHQWYDPKGTKPLALLLIKLIINKSSLSKRDYFTSWARDSYQSRGSRLQAIPSFAMSCFAFCKRIISLFRNFWWGGDGSKSKMCWKIWDIFTRPKFEGWLSFRDFKSFNLALLAKEGRKNLNNLNDFWVNFLKALYFLNSSFLEVKKIGGSVERG